mgnify:CR=1 FL=1
MIDYSSYASKALSDSNQIDDLENLLYPDLEQTFTTIDKDEQLINVITHKK